MAVGDYDNDGWPDIYVANFGKNRLYHNNHDGTFTDVAEKARRDSRRLVNRTDLGRLRPRWPARSVCSRLCRSSMPIIRLSPDKAKFLRTSASFAESR